MRERHKEREEGGSLGYAEIYEKERDPLLSTEKEVSANTTRLSSYKLK